MERSNGNGNSNGGLESRARNQDRTLTEIIQEEPVVCLAVAAAAGFLLGGGARRAGGITVLTMLGQLIVRETLAQSPIGDFISGSLEA